MKKGVNYTIKDGLEEIDFPKILYKYRDWNADFHNRFISNREVFMSSPSSFEDEKDCKNPVRYDLMNSSQIIQFYENVSRKRNLNFSRQQHRKEARNWAKKNLFKDSEYVENYRNMYNDEYDKRKGVLSLTAEPCLNSMWDKYSNNSTGFCIGYNSLALFKFLGGGGEVVYYDELPKIFPEPIMEFNEHIHKNLFAKESKWSFEKEYRTHKFWMNPASIEQRQIKLPKEAFNSIILGCNISEKNKNEVIETVKINIGDIPILNQNNVCQQYL